jgi:small subunit ribosomal protein S16
VSGAVQLRLFVVVFLFEGTRTMAVKLRLQRHGAKKKPFYRIVAADGRARRDGRFLEIVGTYDPNHEEIKLRLKQDRIEHWLNVGAQPSTTVKSLLRRARRTPDVVTFLSGGPAAAAEVAGSAS